MDGVITGGGAYARFAAAGSPLLSSPPLSSSLTSSSSSPFQLGTATHRSPAMATGEVFLKQQASKQRAYLLSPNISALSSKNSGALIVVDTDESMMTTISILGVPSRRERDATRRDGKLLSVVAKECDGRTVASRSRPASV